MQEAATAGTFPGVSNAQQNDINGLPLAGGLLTVYQAGSTTPANVFQDIGLVLPASNPLVADLSGRIPPRFRISSHELPNSHHEVSTAVTALAARNPWAARQLVRAYAESVWNDAARNLQSGPNHGGAAKFAAKIAGNAQQRENLRAAFEALPNGDVLWNGIDRFLQIAEATGQRQAIGSKTSFNDAERKMLEGSGVVGEAVKTGLSPGKWWTVINDKWSKWKLGSNLNDLARIFTDPNSAALLRRINRMPPRSQEAQVLAARLILQAEQSAQDTAGSKRQ